jgi:hypothetical protein
VPALNIQYFRLDSPIRSFQFSILGLAGILEDIARYLDQCLTYQPYSIPVRLKVEKLTPRTSTQVLASLYPLSLTTPLYNNFVNSFFFSRSPFSVGCQAGVAGLAGSLVVPLLEEALGSWDCEAGLSRASIAASRAALASAIVLIGRYVRQDKIGYSTEGDGG